MTASFAPGGSDGTSTHFNSSDVTIMWSLAIDACALDCAKAKGAASVPSANVADNAS